MPKPMVQTPCLFHLQFWRSSPEWNFKMVAILDFWWKRKWSKTYKKVVLWKTSFYISRIMSPGAIYDCACLLCDISVRQHFKLKLGWYDSPQLRYITVFAHGSLKWSFVVRFITLLCWICIVIHIVLKGMYRDMYCFVTLVYRYT